jgi:hypothetical protein
MTTPLPPRSKADKFMPAVAVVLGIAHLVFGAVKVLALPVMVESFVGWQLPTWMIYLLCVV